MIRVRAMTLLFALLGGAGAAMALAAYNPLAACCPGVMCPLHKNHTRLPGKSHCGGVRSSDCACSIDSSAAGGDVRGGATATHAAVLQSQTSLTAPKHSRITASEIRIRTAYGYVVSSELPPRLPNQNNS